MKLITLAKIARALKEMQPVVRVPEEVRDRASRALARMLEVA